MRVKRDVFLQRRRCANPDDLELTLLVAYFPGLQVDVYQRVQLRKEDLDVVSTHASADHRNSPAFVFAHVRDELAFVHLELDIVEVLTYPINAGRITYGDDGIADVLGQQ